jgi:hypothetical protein
MADINAIPQPGTVGFSYPFQAHVYTPGSINPLTAPNWAQVGQTAIEAGKALQNSFLNPVVRAQAQAETMRYQEEQNYLKDLPNHPEWRYLESIGPEGVSFLPGAQGGPNYQASYGFPNKGNNPPPPPPPPAATTDGKTPPKNVAVTQPAPTITSDQGGYAGQPGTSGGGGPESTQPPGREAAPAAPAEPANQEQQERAKKAQQAKDITQATTHLSPAQLSASASSGPVAEGLTQPQQQPSSVPSQFQPTSQGATQPQQQPSNIPSQFQDNTPQMQQWQETTNLHPVGDAKSALNWAQKFDTHFNRATYQSKAGPGGTPAWTFSNKDGASSTVPLPQMVANGYAAQVAGQNLSMGLSASAQQPPAAAPTIASDQGGYAGQPRYGNVPGQPQDLSSQINPATAVASAGGPPASALSAENRAGVLDTKSDAAIAAATADRAADDKKNPSGVSRKAAADWVASHPDGYQGDYPLAAGIAEAHQQQVQDGSLAKLSAPPGSEPYTSINGVTWYTSTDPNDSKVPYLIYSSSPWEEIHLTRDGQQIHFQKPNASLAEEIKTHGLGDPAHMSDDEMVNALRTDYNNRLSIPVEDSTKSRLQTLHEQVLQSQRLLDASHYLTPIDYSMINRLKQSIKNNAYQLSGGGHPLDLLTQQFAKMVAGGDLKPSPALNAFMNAYHTLMGGMEDNSLNTEEKAQLGNVKLDASFAKNIDDLNWNRMAQFNRTGNNALGNRERVSNENIGEMNSIKHSGRIQDANTKEFMNNFSGLPYIPKPYPFMSDFGPGPGQPSATPTPGATQKKQGIVPSNNSWDNPIDMSKMKQSEGDDLVRRLKGSGAVIFDGTRKIRL